MNFFAYLAFFILNIAIFSNSLIIFLVLSKFQKSSFSKVIIGSSVLFFSQIIVFEILLGIFGVLTFFNLFLLILLFSLGLLLIFGKKLYSFASKITYSKLKFDSKFGVTGLLIFTPVTLVLLIKFFNAAFQLPFEYDNVAYHLPFVVEWLNSGSLLQLYYSAFAGPIAYYPSNFELLDLFVMLPFRNDFLINLINFPLFILFGVTIYSIFRKINVSQYISLFCTAVLFYMPIFLRQAGVPLVDLFFSFAFAASIYFLLDEDHDVLSLVLFGLSLGLFIGTKYLGIVYSIPLILVVSFLIFSRKSDVIKRLAILVGSVFLTGGFFYIRNWVNSGNPLFPVDVKIFGFNLFEGYSGVNELISSTSLMSALNNFPSFKIFVKVLYFMTSIGSYLFLLVALIGLFMFVWKLFQPKKILKESYVFLVFSILTICYFFLYLKAPYTYHDLTPNVRYAMMFLICGVLSFGMFVSEVSWRSKTFLKLFYIVVPLGLLYSLLFLVLSSPNGLLYNDRIVLDYNVLSNYIGYFILFICLFGLLVLLNFVKKNFVRILLLVLFFCFSWLFVSFASQERESISESSFEKWYGQDVKLIDLFKGVFWLNNNDVCANVAYTGFNFHYHLYGRNFERQVDYVNINKCLDCRYLDYKDSPNSIRTNPDYESWVSNLNALDKKYVVVQPEIVSSIKNYEFEWMKTHPNKFEQVFRSGHAYIFKIK